MNKHNKTNSGYSLMEMSVVLTVLAVIGVSALGIYQDAKDSDNVKATQDRFTDVNNAVQDYINTHHRMPCPAQADLPESDDNFGLEAKLEGDCALGTPSATVSASSEEGNIAIGVIPVRALGLANSAMYDEWDRRITYVVDQRATKPNAMIEYEANLPHEEGGLGNIQINNANGTELSNQAVYVLLSHGINGIGAYQKNGTQMTDSRFSNALESENNDGDSVFVNAGYQRDSTDKFDQYDDITSYRERWSLITGADVAEYKDPTAEEDDGDCVPGAAFSSAMADVVMMARYDPDTADTSTADDLEALFTFNASTAIPSTLNAGPTLLEPFHPIETSSYVSGLEFSPDNKFLLISYADNGDDAIDIYYSTPTGFKPLLEDFPAAFNDDRSATPAPDDMSDLLRNIESPAVANWSHDGQYFSVSGLNNSGARPQVYKLNNEDCTVTYLKPSNYGIINGDWTPNSFAMAWHPTTNDIMVGAGFDEAIEIYQKISDDKWRARVEFDYDWLCSEDETTYRTPGPVTCGSDGGDHYHNSYDAEWSPDGNTLALGVFTGWSGEAGASIVFYEYNPSGDGSGGNSMLNENYRSSTKATTGSTSNDEEFGFGVAFSPNGKLVFHSRRQIDVAIQVFKWDSGLGRYVHSHDPASTSYPSDGDVNCAVPNVWDFEFSKDGKFVFLKMWGEFAHAVGVADTSLDDVEDFIYLEITDDDGNYICHVVDDGLNSENFPLAVVPN